VLTSRHASGHDVFLAAGNGEAAAVRLLDEQAQALAMGIRAVHALLDPELIVLGGGIGSRPDVLARVRDVLESQRIGAPAIEPSTLGERAALLGAVAAARDAAAERLAAEPGPGALRPIS
jgi:glucokinase